MSRAEIAHGIIIVIITVIIIVFVLFNHFEVKVEILVVQRQTSTVTELVLQSRFLLQRMK